MKNLARVKSIMAILLTVMLCVLALVASFCFSYQGSKLRNEIGNVAGSNTDVRVTTEE